MRVFRNSRSIGASGERTVAPVETVAARTMGGRVVRISALTFPFSSLYIGRIGGESPSFGACARIAFATEAFALLNVLPRPNSLAGTDITPVAGTVWNGFF